MGLSIHYNGRFEERTSLAEMMEEKFKLMSNLLDQVAFGLGNFPKDNEESFESYFERLLKLIHTKRGQ
jgi:hypothetical protein